MKIRLLVAALTLLFPAVAVATSMRPLASVPALPDAPPTTPVLEHPPVLDLALPSRHAPPSIPMTLPDLPEVPPFEPPAGIPDLTALVDLPREAANVYVHAPPFGAPLQNSSRRSPSPVPEPNTAALVCLGLVGLTAVRRRRSAA